MASAHQKLVSAYHRAVATAGHHGDHNMHLFHAEWHRRNPDPPLPSGGPNPNWGVNFSFGSNFLQMHHEMTRAQRNEPRTHMLHESIAVWYTENGHELPGEWDPMTEIPAELGYEPDATEFPPPIRSSLEAFAASRGITVVELLTRNTNQPLIQLPPWFTREGVAPGQRGERLTGARKLADFKNVNQLGCCLVMPHNDWHGRIGGAMGSTATAIADPIFYFGVHWLVDTVYADFLALQAERQENARDTGFLIAHKLRPSSVESLQLPEEFSEEDRKEMAAMNRLSRQLRSGFSTSAASRGRRTITLGTRESAVESAPKARLSGRVGWRSVEKRASGLESAPAEETPQSRAIRSALKSAGIPETVGAATPKEDALGLLKLAAEVEHALMVQYLYATTSLMAAENPSLSSKARVIVRVAIQEMGHLVTVQNMLLGLGGVRENGLPAEHHFGRDALRARSARNPLRLVCEPVSHSALAKYVVVEKPALIADPALAQRVDALMEEATQADKGFSPNPVSSLYAALRWIFQPTDEPSGDTRLTADMGFKPGWHLSPEDFVDLEIHDGLATNEDEWGGYPGLIVMPCRNAAEGCAAIDAIAEQGEGLPGSTNSHFEKFLELLDQFETSAFVPKAIARTPYVTGQKAPEDHEATLLTHPYAELWGRLFNIRYELLLLDLGWSLALPVASENRSPMMELTRQSMSSGIKGISNYLAGLPALADGSGFAGPPYGLENEVLPTSVAGWIDQYADLAARQETLVQAISSHPSLDAKGSIQLETIQDLDSQRAPLLPVVATPMEPTPEPVPGTEP